MSATREQIMEALFAALQATAGFETASRRLQDPEGLNPTDTPALFLVEHEDEWGRKQGFNIQAVREIRARALIYIDAGNDPNKLPASFVNNTLDAIEAAFVPDNRQTNTFTLGGLVLSVTIDGISTRASGDVTGKALVVLPIRILLP
jgi:hypothetical protein